MEKNLIFKRTIEDQILDSIGKSNVLLIFGPRQVGKTTLVKQILARRNDAGAYFNCEQIAVREHFVLGKPEELRELVGARKLVVFDEAQTIVNIGAILKVFVDTYPDVQIIATGSSSFDLANKINEPLTGRARSFTLLPLSLEEIQSRLPLDHDVLCMLMRYGSYPAVVAAETEHEKSQVLRNVATSYLYKDIFMFEKIKNPIHFEQLLKLLAHQIGCMVSMREVAEGVGVSRQTVEKYVRLLEQAYVIKRVYSFSRNKRNELRRSFKVYFLDAGIRNAVLNDVRPPDARTDTGSLFEQFVYSELLKSTSRMVFSPDIGFWRTKQGLEVDFVLEYERAVRAFECKWGTEHVAFTKFLKLYPGAVTQVVRPATVIEPGPVFTL